MTDSSFPSSISSIENDEKDIPSGGVRLDEGRKKIDRTLSAESSGGTKNLKSGGECGNYESEQFQGQSSNNAEGGKKGSGDVVRLRQTITEICPWDHENGTRPDTTTFVKTYSTLGYL